MAVATSKDALPIDNIAVGSVLKRFWKSGSVTGNEALSVPQFAKQLLRDASLFPKHSELCKLDVELIGGASKSYDLPSWKSRMQVGGAEVEPKSVQQRSI